MIIAMAVGASPALAESHPFLSLSFGATETTAFENPNGIAIDESTREVYVAAIGDDTVYKFDASGKPVEFAALKSHALAGSATPAGSFAFPSDAHGTPAAIAVDNSTNSSDPSAGDLYVMDAGHGVIDKFNSEGRYLSQITGFAPATGSAEYELLGIAVDSTGNLLATVAVREQTEQIPPNIAVDTFDDSAGNHLVAEQLNPDGGDEGGGIHGQSQSYGFTVGPAGDDYLPYAGCSCMAKFGQKLSALGRIDPGGSGDVALAVDPATGHVYADAQTSVAEWDTGAMDRGSETISESSEEEATGTLVSRFGSPQLSGSSGQGGIAVNGASGKIYVSNPADGKIYVFGSDAPAVTAGLATAVTKEAATLHGTVDSRGSAIASCAFEYGVVEEVGHGSYEDSVPCAQTPAEIDAGSSPVPVSAEVAGLEAGQLYHFRLAAGSASASSLSSGLVATLGAGFGMKSFEVSFLNEDGSPDTQAGSHPYQMALSFAVNSHYQRMESDADSPYIREPDGTLKNLAIDFPPGLVGDPNATSKKCTLTELAVGGEGLCPPESTVGHLQLRWSRQVPYVKSWEQSIWNMVPPRGVALQVGTNFVAPLLFVNAGLRAGGNYPIEASIVNAPPAAPLLSSRTTISGVVGEGVTRKAFLTLPTGCHGPLRSSIEVESYQEPGKLVKREEVTRNAAGTPVSLTGCSKLLFPPTVSVSPDTSNASSSSGLTVGVHVPQAAAENPDGLAESGLRNTTVALPAGVAINPSGGDGLEGCSEGLAGFEVGRGVGGSGFEEFNPEFEPGVKIPLFTPTPIESLQPGVSLCPDGSKIGTVKIRTPLLEHELEGVVYLASQDANPFESLVAMYLMVEDPVSGSTVKLTGEVRLCAAAGEVIEGVSCQGLGEIITTFKNTPDIPFEELQLHFFGGERAPLATPSRCGTYTTTAIFSPWDGNGPVTTTSSFRIEHGPGGGPCPGARLPFSPSLTGGATNIQAGAFSPLTLTMSRRDGEQNIQSAEAHLPAGLLGVLSNIELCPEPQANLGECGPSSLIGETTVSVGVGNEPFTVSGGKFYLTGPYNGSGGCTTGSPGCAPFGITFEIPAKAGPFDLANTQHNHPACDCVLVRGKIEVNPETTALTVTSDPPGTPDAIPTSLEGIPLEIQHINATTTRGNFQFNPTNCDRMEAVGTLFSSEGSSDTLGVPFQVTNCAALGFAPKFAVSTSAQTSRTEGASLHVDLTLPTGDWGTEANVARVKVSLPKQLPSPLKTLQKACTEKVFEENPTDCPVASRVGEVKVSTPVLAGPLTGPAYFVSHGGAKYPELIFVLTGEDGVTVQVHGETFISKAGITTATFATVPDVPFSTFELTLPKREYPALTADGNLCAQKLTMPTELVGQNGAVIHQTTNIAVSGCPRSKTRAQLRAAALSACHKKHGHAKRTACERTVRDRYGAPKTGKKK
jgi:DNA-binding beta-propeller fold protein YncE